MSNNWIRYKNDFKWTITSDSVNTEKVWISCNRPGMVLRLCDETSDSTVYLDSNVKITVGKGTKNSPYILTK